MPGIESPAPDFCAVSSDKHDDYLVRLMVNGVAVPGRVLQRQYHHDVADKITLTASARVYLKERDFVWVEVVPRGIIKKTLRVVANATAIRITRVNQFG